jgi:error-prone DNA polymerase
MGSKRGLERIESLRVTLYEGMAQNGVDPATADRIYAMIQAFASFGFAESHSLSFALLVYTSAWLKLHYPALYLTGLLRAWPMGFYSPASLVSDAEKHGVEVRRPSVQHSGVQTGVEPSVGEAAEPTGLDSCLVYAQPSPPKVFDPTGPDPTHSHRRDRNLAVRLGLATVRGIGVAVAEKIVYERQRNGPYLNPTDLARRVGLGASQLESLASSGALGDWGNNRRETLWLAGHVATEHPQFLPHTTTALQLPLFAQMTERDVMLADRIFTGVSPGDHPLRHLRESLKEQGVSTVSDMALLEPSRRVWVAGLVTHRQRPATAMGVTFLNLEDETGLVNVICAVGFWKRHRRVLRDSSALIVRGLLERSPEGVVSIVADGVEQLAPGAPGNSRNFQ